MPDYTEKICPQCSQKLRLPKNIGGMLMACPSCGKKFYSDFKLSASKREGLEIFTRIFEMPCTVLDRIRSYFS